MFCFYKFLIHEEDDQRKREVCVFWVTFGNYFLISRTFVYLLLCRKMDMCFFYGALRKPMNIKYELNIQLLFV